MKLSVWIITLIIGIFLLYCPVSASGTYGNILVKSNIPGALVSIDGFINTFPTPYEFFQVTTGRHTLKVEKQGYRIYTNNDVIVSTGKTTTIYANLLKDPDYGTIWVHTFPTGADVFVDQVLKGKTPDEGADGPNRGNLVISDLTDGPHTVRIRLAGYADVVREVSTGPELAGPVSIYENLKSLMTELPTIQTPDQTISVQVQSRQNVPLNGTLTLESVPSGAQVLMNGSVKGVTPLTLEQVVPGPYIISFIYPGYKPVTSHIMVLPGEGNKQLITLSPLQTPVYTPVQTQVPPAMVQTPTPSPVPTQTERSGSILTIFNLFFSLSIAIVVFRHYR